MQVYKDFAPTGFDTHINFDNSRENWILAPISINRDTQDAVTLANWDSIQQTLDDNNLEYEVHRFGHWANGWFEIILVEPTDSAIATLEDIEASLENYPILDDEKMSEIESEQESESWSNYGSIDFYCEYDHAANTDREYDLADQLSNLDIDIQRIIFDKLGGTYEHHSDGVYYSNPTVNFDTLEAVMLQTINEHNGQLTLSI